MRAESVLTLREPLARYVDFISLTQRTLLLVLWFHSVSYTHLRAHETLR